MMRPLELERQFARIQVFRNATQSESTNHDGGAIGDVLDGLVGAGYDLVHWIRILNQIQGEPTTEAQRHRENQKMKLLSVSVVGSCLIFV